MNFQSSSTQKYRTTLQLKSLQNPMEDNFHIIQVTNVVKIHVQRYNIEYFYDVKDRMFHSD